MKTFILMTMLMLGLYTQAQSIILQDKEEIQQDSLDLIGCMEIINDLFKGELYKNDSLQEDHLPYDYYWGKPCDPDDPEFYWILCDKFADKYKENLTEIMYCNMFGGDKHRYTKDMETGRCVMLHWAWTEPDGKPNEVYFDFTIKDDRFQLVCIRRYLSDFWKE
jgi:hypothetical protein